MLEFPGGVRVGVLLTATVEMSAKQSGSTKPRKCSAQSSQRLAYAAGAMTCCLSCLRRAILDRTVIGGLF